MSLYDAIREGHDTWDAEFCEVSILASVRGYLSDGMRAEMLIAKTPETFSALERLAKLWGLTYLTRE
jgi:hypothetical protein